MNEFYLVLSVKEINALSRVARKQQKALKKTTSHCVVLQGLKESPAAPGQISSTSFCLAVRSL
jgi:hypothetical protein